MKHLPWDSHSLIYILGEFHSIWRCISSRASCIGISTIQEGATPLGDSTVGGVGLGRWA
jgi:hypothetical protein